jgi:hypothetical protein
MTDYRDLALEHAAADHVELVARVADLEDERAAYRVLAQEAIHALHHITTERDRLRDRLYRLLDELRGLRQERRAA